MQRAIALNHFLISRWLADGKLRHAFKNEFMGQVTGCCLMFRRCNENLFVCLLIKIQVQWLLTMEEKTLQVVKELMAVQERAYKNAIEILFSEVKNDIRNLNNEIQEMKCSLQFSQKDIDDLNSKVTSIDSKLNSQHIALEHIDKECEGISNQVDYLENQSRRNNIKILGLAESKEERTWEDTEKLIKSTIKDTLGVDESVEIIIIIII